MSNGPYSYATNLRPPLRTTTVSPRYRSMQAGRLPTGGNVSQMGQSGQEGQGNMGVLTAIAIGSAAASAWGAWRQSKAQAKAARIQGESADAALQAERDTEMFNRYMRRLQRHSMRHLARMISCRMGELFGGMRHRQLLALRRRDTCSRNPGSRKRWRRFGSSVGLRNPTLELRADQRG